MEPVTVRKCSKARHDFHRRRVCTEHLPASVLAYHKSSRHMCAWCVCREGVILQDLQAALRRCEELGARLAACEQHAEQASNGAEAALREAAQERGRADAAEQSMQVAHSNRHCCLYRKQLCARAYGRAPLQPTARG